MASLKNLLTMCGCLPGLTRDYLRGNVLEASPLIQDCLCDLDCSHSWEQLASLFHGLSKARCDSHRALSSPLALAAYLLANPCEGLLFEDFPVSVGTPDMPRRIDPVPLWVVSHCGWLVMQHVLGQDVPDDVAACCELFGLTSMPILMRRAGRSQDDVIDRLIATPHMT